MKNLLNFLLLLLLVFCGGAQVVAANDSEKSSCSLQARVFDADGKEFQDQTPGIRVSCFLWQKTTDDESLQETNWKQIGEFYLADPGWTSGWPVKQNVPPGEYRFSFAIHKIYTTWEGPPGTAQSSSGSHHGRVTSVDGYGLPKRIYGWGLSDVITIAAGDTEKKVDLHPDTGPKVRLRTSFFPDPATVPAKDSTPEAEREVLPQRYREASKITMFFRDENLPTDRYFHSSSYGIPWYVDFDQMKPGRYYVHF